jgi:O-antigen/teichoic acid export membrane protein
MKAKKTTTEVKSQIDNDPTQKPVSGVSTRTSLMLVYVAHCFRYVYSLILIPYYGRVLGVEEYGRLLAALAMYQIVWLFIEYACPTNGVRELASISDKNEKAKIFGQQFMARLYLTPIGLGIGLIAINLSPVLLAAPNFGFFALALSIVSAFHIGWYFQGTFQYLTQSILELLSFACSLILILFFVRNTSDGSLVLIILFAVSGTFIALSYIIAIRQFGIRHIRFGGGNSLIRRSTTLFLSRGLNIAMMSSSSYLLSILSTAAQVGYYGAAEKIVLAGISFMQPVGQVLLGKITQGLSSKKTENSAYLLMRKGISGLFLFGCTATLMVSFFSPYLIPLVLGRAFASSIPIIQLLGFIFPFSAGNQAITTYVLIPLKKDHYVVRASAINFLFSILGICYFMFFRKVDGLAFATIRVFSEMMSTLFLAFVICRLHLLSKIIKGIP